MCRQIGTVFIHVARNLYEIEKYENSQKNTVKQYDNNINFHVCHCDRVFL